MSPYRTYIGAILGNIFYYAIEFSSCKMEVLGIADWSECLSFYQLIGKQVCLMKPK